MQRESKLLIAIAMLASSFACAGDNGNDSGVLTFAHGDEEYTVEIDTCILPPDDMTLVSGESDGDNGNVSVYFRNLPGDSGVMFTRIFDFNGVKREESWHADDQMIATSALDGKLITAAGKLDRGRVRTSVDGSEWKTHPDSDSAAQTTFSLTARCP